MTKAQCWDPGRARSGFTLIELMVVLSILALLMVSATSAVSASLPAMHLRSATRILADDLRATRRAALLQRRELALSLRPGGYISGDGDRPPALPVGMVIRLVDVPGGSAAAPDRVRFFADGSSTGGRLELRLGERHSAIAIDWLTGRVRVDE
jgi:general secretion pathway protein H